ncbi:hypothetical protein CB1_000436030 [Camelus ferus]|nr:hypothetical protein CB1_000436030 [Camelus ferus]
MMGRLEELTSQDVRKLCLSLEPHWLTSPESAMTAGALFPPGGDRLDQVRGLTLVRGIENRAVLKVGSAGVPQLEDEVPADGEHLQVLHGNAWFPHFSGKGKEGVSLGSPASGRIAP